MNETPQGPQAQNPSSNPTPEPETSEPEQSTQQDPPVSEPVAEPPEEIPETPAEPEQQATPKTPESAPENPPELTSPAPTEPLPQPETQERVVEKVIEKTVPRELNEEEQSALNRSKLDALRSKGHASRAHKKQEAFQKILGYLKENGFGTNNELQQLCQLGDSTTTRYLKEMEQQGLVIKIGRTRGIRWRLRQGNQ